MRFNLKQHHGAILHLHFIHLPKPKAPSGRSYGKKQPNTTNPIRTIIPKNPGPPLIPIIRLIKSFTQHSNKIKSLRNTSIPRITVP
jgi:hypothetical protein